MASQRWRRRIEEIFDWPKMVGLLRKTRHRGVPRIGWMLTFGLAEGTIMSSSLDFSVAC